MIKQVLQPTSDEKTDEVGRDDKAGKQWQPLARIEACCWDGCAVWQPGKGCKCQNRYVLEGKF